MKALIISLLLLAPMTACAQVSQENKNYCDVDSDCVAAQCCHPTDTVNKKFAPECGITACTMMCKGPLDCGAGKPACVDHYCTIKPLR